LKNQYTLLLRKTCSKFYLPIKALSTNHAQAQAQDIVRALNANELELTYTERTESLLSNLFERLAFNTFTQNECVEWKGSYCNKCPCTYVFQNRIYVKDLILKYLDIPKDKTITKGRCKNIKCINPYHFEYHQSNNSKLTCGDTRLLLAYRGQGTGVNQIAEALNVHRSTIYRKLKNERLSSGSANHSRS
jgi:hypothetical protein